MSELPTLPPCDTALETDWTVIVFQALDEKAPGEVTLEDLLGKESIQPTQPDLLAHLVGCPTCASALAHSVGEGIQMYLIGKGLLKRLSGMSADEIASIQATLPPYTSGGDTPQ